MIKRFKNLFVIFLLALITMTACGKDEESIKDRPVAEEKTEDKKTIYASFYHVAEFVKMIAGDKFDVKTIIDSSDEPIPLS